MTVLLRRSSLLPCKSPFFARARRAARPDAFYNAFFFSSHRRRDIKFKKTRACDLWTTIHVANCDPVMEIKENSSSVLAVELQFLRDKRGQRSSLCPEVNMSNHNQTSKSTMRILDAQTLIKCVDKLYLTCLTSNSNRHLGSSSAR